MLLQAGVDAVDHFADLRPGYPSLADWGPRSLSSLSLVWLLLFNSFSIAILSC